MRFALPSLFAAATAIFGAESRPLPPVEVRVLAPPGPDTRFDPTATPCPSGTLPDGNVCVHLPGDGEDGADSPASANLHRERSGRWSAYDQIPRRPDRPADYDAYRYPVTPGLPGGHSVISGYDLDRPD